LLRISSFDLSLMATHPDRAGGLGVLTQASLGMGRVGFGIAALGAADWGTRIVGRTAEPADFTHTAVAFVAIILALAFAPLLVFAPALRRAKFHFLHEYSALADRYAELFHQKWLKQRAPD
jgi:hypothetical protein